MATQSALRGQTQTHRQPSFERARAVLATRLNARREEIESAVLTRVFAIDGPSGPGDPEYLEGLRGAVSAAVEFGLEIVARGEERAPAPPPALLAQTRLAARAGIGLDTVLRRYSAGYVLLTDFLLEEAEQSGLRGALHRLMRIQTALDRILAAVSEEYAREANERKGITSDQRRAERIDRLLAGEPIDTSEFAYDFDGFHIGVVAAGAGVEEALRPLASSLDANLLTVRREDDVVWAWLGARRVPDLSKLERQGERLLPEDASMALGEPARGLLGWRLTHRQAGAALPIAVRGSRRVVRYANTVLLVAVLQHEIHWRSLQALFLEPIEAERDGGATAFETLRAYFAAECNATSAAAALGISRQAVNGRLRIVEDRLGRPVNSCAAELEIALEARELQIASS